MSKVPFGKLLKGVRGILFILLFSAALNIFLTPGVTVAKLGFIVITKEGLVKGAYISVRLVYLIICTSIMTLTTTPNDLSDGLEKSFGFLKVIKFPVHEIAMIISLSLRFIPTLVEETEKITKAQFLYLCLYHQSEEHWIWQQQWKQDVTMVGKEQR